VLVSAADTCQQLIYRVATEEPVTLRPWARAGATGPHVPRPLTVSRRVGPALGGRNTGAFYSSSLGLPRWHVGGTSNGGNEATAVAANTVRAELWLVALQPEHELSLREPRVRVGIRRCRLPQQNPVQQDMRVVRGGAERIEVHARTLAHPREQRRRHLPLLQ